MSYTFITLDQRKIEQNDDELQSLYIQETLPYKKQIQQWKTIAYNNYERKLYQKPAEQTISIDEDYSKLYEQCNVKFQYLDTTKADKYIQKYRQKIFNDKPQRKLSDQMNTINFSQQPTTRNSDRMRSTRRSHQTNRSFFIKGKTFYVKLDYSDVFENLRSKLKTQQQEREQRKNVTQRTQRTQYPKRQSERKKSLGPSNPIKRVINQCNNFLKNKQNLDQYTIDNHDFPVMFMIKDEVQLNFEPERQLRIKLKNNEFLEENQKKMDSYRQVLQKKKLTPMFNIEA